MGEGWATLSAGDGKPGRKAEEQDVSLVIGGDAGQGVESSGAGFSTALARAGYHVFSIADYRSRIRGGHNFYQIRAATRPVASHLDPPALLLALTAESVELHLENLADGAAVVYDRSFRLDAAAVERAGRLPVPVPMNEIALRHGSKVMMNTAALAAAAGLLRFPLERMEEVVRQNFARKGERVVEANLAVAREAYAEMLRHPAAERFRYRLPGREGQPERMLLHGNHALCLGALAAGCRFVAAYPMTPATTILEWMTAHAEPLGIVTKHAEDELAAVCMAIGAGFGGARAMCSTSGGGFSLMTEALGLAGMTETPVVVVDVQRGGPSTGLPTRTEQGDLLFVLHASQGEFPRFVLAPGDHVEAFEAAMRAFNLAEKYQVPVILLSDQFLASSLRTLEPERLRRDAVPPERGKTRRPGEPPLPEERRDGDYLRFAFTADGISPRVLPGDPDAVYGVPSDEHDEAGHITEEIANRRRMMEKRMRKLETALAAGEMRGPRRLGPEEAEVTLLAWGSTLGPAAEALELLARAGVRANLLHWCDLWPFAGEAAERELRRVRRGVVVEQNYTGQFRRFLRMMTGYEAEGLVRRYDGRPLEPGEIARGVLREVGAGVR
ncbi:MAG: 2-oxoacid:acceptor oxidoreductase subunit alpha [Firmicutes bacterium]|nr:2-oxoacid:acceptor oxidoreductase subunit alpha [Bacillota bacterium]